MNLDKILSSLSEPISGQATTRRESLLKTAGLARKAVAATLPLGLGGIAFPARAAVSSADALNLALELKLMLKALYEEGNAATFASTGFTGVISAADVKKIIAEIQPKVEGHIAELTAAVTEMGGTPVSKQYSLTGNPSGSLGTVFTDRRVFMALAQVLHDVSSRGIKGLMPELESSGENLMAGIKIQAADARYATLWNIARSTASTQFYPSENSDYTNLPQE
ncbi:MAG: hypothetical protein EOP49_50195, partial [Sphingobacteriales bacterium]